MALIGPGLEGVVLGNVVDQGILVTDEGEAWVSGVVDTDLAISVSPQHLEEG